MGISDRIPKLKAGIAQWQANTKDIADAMAAIELFNARSSRKLGVVSWPTIGAALIAKHHWAAIHCRSCDTITDMDLRVKRRDAAQPVCVILSDIRCPRCNGHGRPAIVKLMKLPSE